MGEASVLRGTDLLTGERRKQYEDYAAGQSQRLGALEDMEQVPPYNLTQSNAVKLHQLFKETQEGVQNDSSDQVNGRSYPERSSGVEMEPSQL